MTASEPIVGIDLGGTNMQIGVVDAEGKIIGTSRRKTKADEGMERVLDRLVEGVERACDDAGIKTAELAAVGIGAPSPVEIETGTVLEAVNLRWTDVPLAAILSERLGAPVFVDNDVNVAVYGEWRAGAGQGVNDLLGVWVGTGVGGGLILNGRLYHGATFTAGEIGHVTLFPRAAFGNRSLENNCSRTAVVNRLVGLIRANHKSVLSKLPPETLANMKSRIVAEAYRNGDELVRTVVDDAAELLGISIAGAVTLLGLPRVVLGGGLTEAVGEPFIDAVRESMRRHAFPQRARSVEVVASALEDDAGLLGAALIARRRLSGEPA